MGERFVGSSDYTLLADGEVSDAAPRTGGFVDIAEAEQHDLEVSVTSSQEDVTVVLEADNGMSAGTQQVTVLATVVLDSQPTDSESVILNLGGLPGARRVRATAAIAGSSKTADVEVLLKETRSGIA